MTQYIIDREIKYKGHTLVPQYIHVESWNDTVYMVRAFVEGKKDKVTIMNGAYKMVMAELREFIKDYNIKLN